jgi:DNA polymerase III delta subunit
MAARENPPERELAELESLWRAAGPKGPPGAVLRGAERYFREQALELCKHRATSLGCEVVALDAQSSSFTQAHLCEELRGAGLFASARCLIVRGAELAFGKREGGPKQEPPALRALHSFLQRGEGPLVLEGDGLRADAAAVKAIVAAGGKLFSFRRMYDSPPPWEREGDPRSVELVAWLVQRARAKQLQLTPEQALLLVQARGNDPGALLGELAQFEPGQKPRFAGLAGDAAGAPFRAAEGMLEGDAPRALRELESLWRGGMDKEGGGRETGQAALMAVLLVGLRRGVRTALAAALALERGLDFEQAAEQAGVAKQPLARAALERQLRAADAAAWRARLDELLELEQRSRDGSGADVNDAVAMALRWAKRPGARAGAAAGGRR